MICLTLLIVCLRDRIANNGWGGATAFKLYTRSDSKEEEEQWRVGNQKKAPARAESQET